MSVASLTRKQQFTLDGATADYTFTFRALTSAPTDIKCISTTNGTDTIRVYTTEYSVAVNASGIGGTLTLVSPSTVGKGTLTIYRETTNKQESDYNDYNQFPAETVEQDLDIRTLVSQELSEELDRGLTLPISVSGVSAELPVPSADKVLGWNSAATAIENKTFTPSTSFEKALAADAVAGTNDAKYLTPTMATIMIATFAPTIVFTGTFTTTTLSSGVLVITHSKALTSPFAIDFRVFDNTFKEVLPDTVLGSTNKVEVDLNSYGTIAGTWGYRYI